MSMVFDSGVFVFGQKRNLGVQSTKKFSGDDNNFQSWSLAVESKIDGFSKQPFCVSVVATVGRQMTGLSNSGSRRRRR